MGRLLFVTLTVSLSSLGSLIQSSHSPSNSGSVQITQSRARNNSSLDSLASEVIFQSESPVEGSRYSVGSMKLQQLINQAVTPLSKETHSGSGIIVGTEPSLHHSGPLDPRADKANTSITGNTHPSVPVISEGALLEGGHITAERLQESHTSAVKHNFPTHRPKLPFHTSAFTSMINYKPSEPGGPCVLGVGPCIVLKNFNGTSLLWDDMRRTLAFAWELHVFGSASLFSLMACLAVLGMAGACTLPRPLCYTLILANSFLIMGGSLRTILLMLDPYGTRQILSHATLAALHNVPLQLLLWAQLALALVTLKGLNLLLFPLKLQHPWVVGGFGIFHCSALFVADLYSLTLTPAVPLLLQTLSLCWGLPFCLGILTKALSNLQPFLRSSLPQWAPSQRAERRGKRVIAGCAFLGVLCCSLQMYSLFWLYGLLGNWRRFGWGWWLSQFWARLLELAWGFSLVLATVWKVPLKKSDKSWEDLMPNNWTKYNLSKAGISNNIMSPYDDQTSTQISEPKSDPGSSSSDSQAALLWQKVGERECILSLIEFDMRPPSPINLRRSIDNAFHHGQLVAGSLFTPPPPSWTMGTNDEDGGLKPFPPAFISYGWMDTDMFWPLSHFVLLYSFLFPLTPQLAANAFPSHSCKEVAPRDRLILGVFSEQ
uniref:Si:ch211-14i3.2 n=1 Tax=Neolamprologus brichardi TaxID=32507 RepID=A0A3Q4GDA3_NEOBR